MTAVYRPDLSYLAANAVSLGKTRYFMISTHRLRLGHEEDFTAGAKMIVSGLRKAMSDGSLISYQVIAGAPVGTYLFLEPMGSLKDLDSEPARDKAMADAIGSDNFRRLTKGEGDVFESIQSTLFAVSPSMSYVTKETEEEDPAFWRPEPAPAKSKAKPVTSTK
jgi:hypothetical protein